MYMTPQLIPGPSPPQVSSVQPAGADPPEFFSVSRASGPHWTPLATTVHSQVPSPVSFLEFLDSPLGLGPPQEFTFTDLPYSAFHMLIFVFLTSFLWVESLISCVH